MHKIPILRMAVILLFMLCPLLVWAGAKVPKATYEEVMYFNGTLIAMRLKQLGDDVLLTTTDPTNHINAQKSRGSRHRRGSDRREERTGNDN